MKGISNSSLLCLLPFQGGYHFEMKGISNHLVPKPKVENGGYHFEMKGISNVEDNVTFASLVVIILKWKVYPTLWYHHRYLSRWLSFWNERYIQPILLMVPKVLGWLSFWNERYIQHAVGRYFQCHGGYHFEMKGISNRYPDAEYPSEVVIILKWKVYPTIRSISPFSSSVVIILKWKVYPTNVVITVPTLAVVIILKWKVYPTNWLWISLFQGWLSFWNERYIQQRCLAVLVDVRWLSFWNERYIQQRKGRFYMINGGYHFEMKGISN